MPYVKFISGHAESTRDIQEYLERDDRHLAEDFINAQQMSVDGLSWSEVMDQTRLDYGTQAARRGQRARRYEHIIISLDPHDDVSLDEFRDYVTSIASRWFDDSVGRFQVAIVYHDDNSERIANGRDGVLHAHLVINNAELESGLRLSPKLTPKVVNDFATDVNAQALSRGWRGFASNGVSMTLAEMQARHLSPSRGRYAAKVMAEGITVPGIAGEEEYVFADDARADGVAAASGPSFPQGPADRSPIHDPGSKEGDDVFFDKYKNKDRARAKPGSHGPREAAPERAGAKSLAGESGDYRVKLKFSDGSEHVFEFTRQPSREDIPERRLLEREGHSWKQDIRDRVDVATRLAESSRDFLEICDLLGVGVSYNKAGEIKFSHPTAPDTRVVKGSTLGRGYSASSISTSIAMKDASRRQRAHNLPGRERYMREQERAAAAGAALSAEPDTARGASDMTVIRDFIAYNDAHNIHSYDDYPDTLAGRAARSYAELIGAFDTAEPRRLDPDAPLLDRLELQRFIREETGAGGLGHVEQQSRPEGESIDRGVASGEQPRKTR